MLPAGERAGVGVDDGAGQTGYRLDELLFGGHGRLVGLRQGEVGRQDQIAVGVELMADPAQSHPANFDHTGHLGQGLFGSAQ